MPRKEADLDMVVPGEDLEYGIIVPANPELGAVSEAMIFDELPEWVRFVDIVECSAGECGYDELLHMVYMQGAVIAPGGTLILRFDVEVVVEPEVEFPPEILNCATVYDGVAQHEVCVSTALVVESEPPSIGNVGAATLYGHLPTDRYRRLLIHSVLVHRAPEQSDQRPAHVDIAL